MGSVGRLALVEQGAPARMNEAGLEEALWSCELRDILGGYTKGLPHHKDICTKTRGSGIIKVNFQVSWQVV